MNIPTYMLDRENQSVWIQIIRPRPVTYDRESVIRQCVLFTRERIHLKDGRRKKNI